MKAAINLLYYGRVSENLPTPAPTCNAGAVAYYSAKLSKSLIIVARKLNSALLRRALLLVNQGSLYVSGETIVNLISLRMSKTRQLRGPPRNSLTSFIVTGMPQSYVVRNVLWHFCLWGS